MKMPRILSQMFQTSAVLQTQPNEESETTPLLGDRMENSPSGIQDGNGHQSNLVHKRLQSPATKSTQYANSSLLSSSKPVDFLTAVALDGVVMSQFKSDFALTAAEVYKAGFEKKKGKGSANMDRFESQFLKTVPFEQYSKEAVELLSKCFNIETLQRRENIADSKLLGPKAKFERILIQGHAGPENVSAEETAYRSYNLDTARRVSALADAMFLDSRAQPRTKRLLDANVRQFDRYELPYLEEFYWSKAGQSEARECSAYRDGLIELVQDKKIKKASYLTFSQVKTVR